MDLNISQFYQTWVGGLLSMIRAIQDFLFTPMQEIFSWLPDFSPPNLLIQLLGAVYPPFLEASLASLILGGGIIVLLVWRLIVFIVDLIP